MVLLIGWFTDPLKLNCKFVYAALGKNPAVLKGPDIAGGHMPFLVVVALTDLSKVNSPVKSGDTNLICTAKPDKPSRTRKGCNSMEPSLKLSGVISLSNPLPVHTCHVDRLGEDIFLSTACSVVFLYEVRVACCIAQRCGCQENIYARAEHVFKIFSDKTPRLLCFHKVTLVVPVKKGREM